MQKLKQNSIAKLQTKILIKKPKQKPGIKSQMKSIKQRGKRLKIKDKSKTKSNK